MVHGLASQVSEIQDEINKKPQDYNVGNRSVFILQDTQSTDAALNFLTQHRHHILNKEGFIFISHRGVTRGVDINGVEAATMVINFRFANAAELEQTLGRGNRSPHLYKPVHSLIFVDPEVSTASNLSTLQTTDLGRLCPTQLNKLANSLNGLVTKTLPTPKGVVTFNDSLISHQQQFADASNIVAELFGNSDQLAHQYAMWVHLEETVKIETEKNIRNGISKPVLTNHQQAYDKGLEHLTQSVVARFPFKSLKWADQEDVARAKVIKSCISEYTQMIGPIKMALILLQRAISCIFNYWEVADSSGLKELALCTEAYANILLVKQKSLELGGLGLQLKSVFSLRLMHSATVSAVDDNYIHKAIYAAAGLPLNRFVKLLLTPSQPTQQGFDEFADCR